MTATLTIPSEGRIFEGHFPGNPILAGVAQLVLIARAVGAGPVRGIPHFRFRGVVVPGDRLGVTTREAPGGLAVDVTREGRTVASGTLLLGRPSGPADAATAVAARHVAGAPPLDALLPHRPPMRFVSRIVGEAEDGMTCEATVPVACALVEGGGAPAFVAVEAAAQTAAVREGLRRSRAEASGEPSIGYLVGLQDVELYAERVPAGVPVLATVVLDAAAGGLVRYRAEVSLEAMPLLRGGIAVFAP